jgi:hypothetical protein
VAGETAEVQDTTGLTFDEWRRRTGFDAASKVVPGGKDRPAGMSVFVRPNQYEPGRGHVAVYNWDRQPRVNVDLSPVLRRGARYAVHNVQDLYGPPVVSGTFDGAPVMLPMLSSPIAPDFDAFLVRTLE